MRGGGAERFVKFLIFSNKVDFNIFLCSFSYNFLEYSATFTSEIGAPQLQAQCCSRVCQLKENGIIDNITKLLFSNTLKGVSYLYPYLIY